MDFALADEHLMIQEVAREFAQKKLAPRAAEFDETGQLDRELIHEMGRLGLLGIIVPEEYGGSGMDHLSYVIAMEELAAGCSSHTSVVGLHNSLFGYPLLSFGTEEQKQKYLPPICSGEKLAAYSLSEAGSGTDAASLNCTAVDKGDHFLVNGTKLWVTDGDIADYILLFVRTDKDAGAKGITALLVDVPTKGYSAAKSEKKMGFKASPTNELSFNNVLVPKDNVLGEIDAGFKVAMETLNSGRISVAAQALGIARAAFEIAIKYVQERRQFGKPLAAFQLTQAKIADMQTKLHAARLMIHHAAWKKDRGEGIIEEASMAKLFASEAATAITHMATQLLGGYGYTPEYHVERLYRDARVTEIFEGTSEIQRLVIAREALKRYAI
ncbi:MAG: acyl-CoA dehydrogenase family protein [candidate division Zixibacteria bacterium]|nr:acyl-CoA dehydrogenase family protein [candidate division Zixibacteria bacterium]